MVFSSIPSAYLDPSNWQQQQQQQPNHQNGATSANPHLPPPPPQPHGGGVGGSGSIRPGSMADRARMANVPMPETALKCPRCESTNTKFCYFNNYSLSQPRHFCKTCRRYWTRGGALRSVPVGGGCRRNKRSKSSSSKSPATSSDIQTASSATSSVSTNSGSTASILGLCPQIPPFRFMAPLHQLGEYGGGAGNMSLAYAGISSPTVAGNEMNFQLGGGTLSGGGGGGGLYLSAGGGGVGVDEQWRVGQAQTPLMGGLDMGSGLYPFLGGVDHTSGNYVGGEVRPKLIMSSSSISQAVKTEENNQGINLSRQFMGIHPGSDQYWMTDLSGFNTTSSSANPL